MKTKLQIKNTSTQHINKTKTKYEFTHSSFFWQAIIIMPCAIGMMAPFMLPFYLFDNSYRIAGWISLLVFSVPVSIIVAAIAIKLASFIRRYGMGVLHENHLELHLHKTKYIIEYQNITSLDTWPGLAPRGLHWGIGLQGRDINIFPVAEFGKKLESSKSIIIFQEALAKKIQDKGLTVKRRGIDINKEILKKANKKKAKRKTTRK